MDRLAEINRWMDRRERDGQKYERMYRQTDIQTNGETDISIFWIDGQTAREREGQADVFFE